MKVVSKNSKVIVRYHRPQTFECLIPHQSGVILSCCRWKLSSSAATLTRRGRALRRPRNVARPGVPAHIFLADADRIPHGVALEHVHWVVFLPHVWNDDSELALLDAFVLHLRHLTSAQSICFFYHGWRRQCKHPPMMLVLPYAVHHKTQATAPQG